MTTRASIRFHVGDMDQILQAAFTGNDAATHRITGISWSSDATGVATITAMADANRATLHAVGPGTANITITAHRSGAADLTRAITVAVWAAATPQVEIAVLSPMGSAS